MKELKDAADKFRDVISKTRPENLSRRSDIIRILMDIRDEMYRLDSVLREQDRKDNDNDGIITKREPLIDNE